MKIRTKASLVLFSLGTVLLLLISFVYQHFTYNTSLEQSERELRSGIEEIAYHIQNNLQDKALIAETLSTTPVLQQALIKSNAAYSKLQEVERAQQIEQLNQRWKETSQLSDPFIQSHFNNPAAQFLRAQQALLPGLYGEIFLTNRYGAMIATTGKLSTLAHAHKYWWQAAYDDGRGRVFIDDRGYDTSVGDFVLGVVVPVRDGDEIIGILKCNFKITGPISQLMEQYNNSHSAQLKLVRTGGLIVSGGTGEPLSERLDDKVVAEVAQDRVGGAILEHSVIAYSPIAITQGSERYGFGGSYESIDHIKGNSGEAWHVVTVLDKQTALKISHDTNRMIVVSGVFFILLGAGLAILTGNQIARPIQRLSEKVKQFGERGLDKKIEVGGCDELKGLAESFNSMADHLSSTMISRDKLSAEVERRKEVEEKLHLLATTDELTGAHNRRMFTQKLKEEMARARRYQTPLALVMFDADLFKEINDKYGHDVGDCVLTKMVHVANDIIREQDLLARWGGEEFIVVMPHTGLEAALQLGERLKQTVAEYEFDLPTHVTISIGVAELQGDDTGDTFIKRADNGLYKAKRGGRNQVAAA